MSVRNAESILYEQLAQYLNLKYPYATYHFDLAGVNNLSPASRALYGRLNRRGWPDLFIAATAMHAETTTPYNGLFLELKAEGVRLRKRDDTWASPHIAEQAQTHEELSRQGFIAMFAVGYDEAVSLIDSYMANRLREVL